LETREIKETEISFSFLAFIGHLLTLAIKKGHR